MSQRITSTAKRGIVMGFLNILAYIGIGLLTTGVFMGISFAMSRPKETVLYEDGSASNGRGEGSWIGASVFSIFVLIVIATLLLFNFAHFSILKSIGLGVLSGIAVYFLLFLGTTIITKKTKFTDNEFNKQGFVYTIIINLLNGAGFAILAYNWGWF